ncbi:MAG: DUF302 domain-containing protein [bacterium]|nr:DUF302 domain-containing protein [bacterium]
MKDLVMESLGHKVESNKSFEQICADLETATTENQFRLLAVHDVQETLAGKGFEREPLKIFELCNAGFAHQALQKHIDVAMFMPCRITIYPVGDKTVMTLAKPTMISQMMPGIGLDELAQDVEQRMIKIMETASK